MIDRAASGDRPDRVYATTPQGLQVSDNRGKTFTLVADAPPLTHLDAPAVGVLTGSPSTGNSIPLPTAARPGNRSAASPPRR